MSRLVSGDRFRVIYRLAGNEAQAREQAEGIGIEQTVEFPPDLLPEGPIRTEVLGRVERLEAAGDEGFLATLSYAVETAGNELTQFLNVVFGNSSIKPGIRVERLELPETMIREIFPGPRFGRAGLRRLLGVARRPLLCTALKPMGLSAEALAALAHRFALGGIDIIKDDHGLANQSFAPFEERVRRCSRAVADANAVTGQRCIYMPNVTAGCGETVARGRLAKRLGAGALLVSPGLAGWDCLRALAADPEIGLPVFCHPAFSGTYVLDPMQGLSHAVLYGQLPRLAGADAVIYPNYGGRFSFSPEDCREIVAAGQNPMAGLEPIFPCPGGGLGLERIAALKTFYGPDVIYLIGGGLFRPGPDLVENCKYFRRLVEME